MLRKRQGSLLSNERTDRLGGMMTVVYKPTRRMRGENARPIEYELRKIQEKLDDLEARVTALGG